VNPLADFCAGVANQSYLCSHPRLDILPAGDVMGPKEGRCTEMRDGTDNIISGSDVHRAGRAHLAWGL